MTTTDLTPTEYATRLGVSRDTLARYLRDAEMRNALPVPPYRLPGSPSKPRWRFPAAEVARVHGVLTAPQSGATS